MISLLLLRSVISGTIAVLLYLLSAGVVSRFWTRGVSRSVLKHDVKLAIISLAFGSPVLQIFALGAEKYHFGLMYADIGERGYAYWLLSLPLYIFCWDAVFYLTHRVLHIPFVYRHCHFRHHSCRPPVPWSGIAIDPYETILSGIMPYTIPLFFFPFHIYTVYALNIGLMVWATWVHSSFDWSGNAVMLSPKDHNLHHAFGLKNTNFAAVFTFYDRLAGTLNRRQAPPWWGKESWKPSGHLPVGSPVAEGIVTGELPVLAQEGQQPGA
jgi:Delta7-sterol 5-desaturase